MLYAVHGSTWNLGVRLVIKVGLGLKGERELCINGDQHVMKITVKALAAAFHNTHATLHAVPEQSFYLDYLVFMTTGIRNHN